MKKIIISGSEGFVGKHLISKLSKNKKIKLIKMNRKFGDIKKKYTWRKLLSADVLIHLAGQSFDFSACFQIKSNLLYHFDW